jgi:outer membrane protein assembly factor BamD (BamD/ComL family)
MLDYQKNQKEETMKPTLILVISFLVLSVLSFQSIAGEKRINNLNESEWYEKGIKFYSVGKWQEAIDAFTNTIELNHIE